MELSVSKGMFRREHDIPDCVSDETMREVYLGDAVPTGLNDNPWKSFIREGIGGTAIDLFVEETVADIDADWHEYLTASRNSPTTLFEPPVEGVDGN